MSNWYTINDSSGTSHEICMQKLDNSCTAACVAMVVRVVAGTGCDESTARSTIAAYIRAKYGTDKIYFAFKEDGIDPEKLGSALSDLKVSSAHTKHAKTWDELRSLYTEKCSFKKPGITGVYWDGGGGHCLVCLGKVGTNLLILDPIFGPQEIDPGVFPRYNAVPHYPSTEGHGGSGNFADICITTV